MLGLFKFDHSRLSNLLPSFSLFISSISIVFPNSALFAAFAVDPSSQSSAPLFRGVPVRDSDVLADTFSEFSALSSAVYAPEATVLCNEAAGKALADLRSLRKHVDDTEWQFVDFDHGAAVGDSTDERSHAAGSGTLDHASASDMAAITAPLCVPAAKRPEPSNRR